MSEGMMAKAGATPHPRQSWHRHQALVAVVPVSGNSTPLISSHPVLDMHLLCPHKYTQKHTDFSALLLQKVGIG